jgi:hypothetical protein
MLETAKIGLIVVGTLAVLAIGEGAFSDQRLFERTA